MSAPGTQMSAYRTPQQGGNNGAGTHPHAGDQLSGSSEHTGAKPKPPGHGAPVDSSDAQTGQVLETLTAPEQKPPAGTRQNAQGPDTGEISANTPITHGALPVEGFPETQVPHKNVGMVQSGENGNGARVAGRGKVIDHGIHVSRNQMYQVPQATRKKPEMTKEHAEVVHSLSKYMKYSGALEEKVVHLERELGDSRALKAQIRKLELELQGCRNDLWEADRASSKFRQQILELGWVAEGATDSQLHELCGKISQCAATDSPWKVFGKPTGTDHERLGGLLSPQLRELLRQFGKEYYNHVFGHKLYEATAAAVDRRYCVGAASGLHRLMDLCGISADPQAALSVMKDLERILQQPYIGVSQREMNVWRSSFTKILQHIPEVKSAADCTVSGLGTDSEIAELFHEVWEKLEPHLPEGNKGSRWICKLLRLQADLRLKMRKSLASYELRGHAPGTPFDRKTMSIVNVADGACEERELQRLYHERGGREVVVGFCFLPTLYKRGNDQGHDLDKGYHVVYRATVLPLYSDHPLLQGEYSSRT